MSHYLTFVLLPPGPEMTREEAAVAIAPRLAPFNENMEVEEYDEKCYCIGDVAHAAARQEAETKCGALVEIQKAYYAAIKEKTEEKVGPYSFENRDAFFAAQSSIVEELHELYFGEHMRVEKEAFEAHPGKDKPDPACENCNGKGTYRSTYNPKSKWDWYQIGNRFEGVFAEEYNPADDPANYEECRLCCGTGCRSDDVGRAQRAKDPTFSCNGCLGTGRARNFFNRPTDYNIARAEEVLRLGCGTFAVLTPDGMWHERGRMRMFGMVEHEEAADAWQARVKTLLQQHPEHWVVAVDMHI